MSDGLHQKYVVHRADDGTPVEDCFVLRPENDEAARVALLIYSWATGNTELEGDIREWVGERDGDTFEVLESALYNAGFEISTRDLDEFLEPVHPDDLSADMQEALETSRQQRENGETVSAAEARERLGLDDNGGDGDA